jgi:beta-glucosidase/6-phospho-beta-glucosidase/beta-galactosidase
VANDHYHRYAEDVALMKSISATAYRFSVSWTRIFPDGTGQPNPKGVGFYSRLVDELLGAGIEPFATLNNWDLPLALEDRYRGWQSMETVQAFADYAGYVAGQLGDRVKHLFTINEFRSFVEAGYSGVEVQVGGGKTIRMGAPPELQLPAAGLNQVRHHAVLGHGLAVQAIRASGRADTKVGFVENMAAAVPVIAAPEYVQAAETATRELNAAFLTVSWRAGTPMPTSPPLAAALRGSPTRSWRPSVPRSISPGSTCTGRTSTSRRRMSRRDTAPSRSVPRIPRWPPPGTSSTPRSCTGLPAWSRRSGDRMRSSSPRTGAPQRTP